jgi:prepilin-type N-terminal cleavage/methylation domain-containing protein
MTSHLVYPARLTGRSAFTLIELLSVIAIVGVLAAILIPTVGVVKRSAHKSAAATQIRGLGVGLQLYVQDNRGYLPVCWNLGPNKPNIPNHWADAILPYLGSVSTKSRQSQQNTNLYSEGAHEVLVAPGIEYLKPDGGEWKRSEIKVSYTATLALAKVKSLTSADIRLARNFKSIVNPARTYLLYQGKQRVQLDGFSWIYGISYNTHFLVDVRATPGTPLRYVDLPYNGTGMFLRADGSVVALTQADLPNITAQEYYGL